MTITTAAPAFTDTELIDYGRDGYIVARGLFTPQEVAECKDFFDALAERGEPIPDHWSPSEGDDVLKRYPRVMHPHLIDEGSKRRLIDPRVRGLLAQLMGEPAVAVQTMFYFKPPGARGQAFHQDNYFLQIKPQTCVAAWLAVDRSTPENGGLQLCPGTQDYEVQCPEEADSTESFTQELVRPPEGHDPVKLVLEPGDVLFFNGSVVHGSGPNRTTDQWRRSFISHYMPATATHTSQWYAPALIDFDGNPIARETNDDGGPCGVEFGEGRDAIH
jgi:ectoine hydroxylase-related dioxygenase (phytanoyl-CoA dioxygenase family)